jgi:DNA polymerase III subunit epsilon
VCEAAGRRVTALLGLPVLLLDAQATSADPERGALVEIGWARGSAGEIREPTLAEVTALVVSPPPGAAMPPAVARITGLRTADWVVGVSPALAWERLRGAADRIAPPPVPVIVHFARFEEPLLRSLHLRHGEGPFPLDVVCTHAIACRLLPELPRRTLRALAGYFGAAVAPLRRCADHVAATAVVWRHLVGLLAEREGVVNLEDLREWLTRPARRAPRRFPLPRERRLELPDRPGVYRLLRAGGAVLYVGKAASLRQRVSGHFHSRGGERALEMLTQARDVDCTETETALEAALLESDEIKRLAPPFNVALAATGRAVCFATADLSRSQETPDGAHTVGPLASAAPVEASSALRGAIALGGAPPLAVRARALGAEPAWAPGPECFAAGLDRFVREHGPVDTTRSLLRLGARLWALRRSEAAVDPEGAEEPTAGAPHRPAWDEERALAALEETVLRAAHAVRRARWLVRLSECSLAWTEPGTQTRRLLVLRGGAVAARADLPPGAPVPVPPGHARTAAQRRAAFDVATFDRLRVLTTELRGLAREAASIELRMGSHARLSRRRLQAVLRWV